MVTFASLSLWLLFKEQREIRKYFGIVFVISFLFYLAYYLLNPGIIGYIRLALGITMLFFGGFILNAFSANKILFVLLLLASLLGLWYLPDIPRIPFLHSDKVSQIKGLDANFEILAELKQGKTFKDIDEIIRKYQLQTEKAFDVKNSDLTDLDDYIVLNIPENQLKNFDNIIQELNDSGQFDAIEHNEVLTLFEPLKISNKKRGKGTSYLNDPELNKLWTTEILQFDSLHQFIAKKNILPLKKARNSYIGYRSAAK